MKINSKIFISAFLSMLLLSFQLTTSKSIQTKPAEKPSEKPFLIVGEMPRFPGGKMALNRYITEHLTYPFEAMKHNIHGKVNVEFVVEKDGSLVQVRTVGPKLGYGLEEQAVKIFSNMPKWIPGKQDGKVVPVYQMIPIIFSN